MANWWNGLTDKPLLANNLETLPQLTVRTAMDVGPDKVRKRITADSRFLQCTFLYTTAEVASFDTFYITTTNGGADTFRWQHPRTGTEGDWMMVGQPTYQAISDGEYHVTLLMENRP